MSQFWEWLLSPVDPSREHLVDFFVSWHARIMVLAWGIAAPLLVLIARYFKILPWQDWPNKLDNPTWWRLHWIGQTCVIALTCLGLALILSGEGTTGQALLHKMVGYAVVTLGAAQALSGVFRGSKGGPTAPASDGSFRGDHYDMTPRRLVFETVHKTLGHALLIAAMACILLGLRAANAPAWMWLVIIGWWVALCAAAIRLHAEYGSYDTYQAIWGPDTRHPGNRMKKRGWGTVRPGDQARIWGKRGGR